MLRDVLKCLAGVAMVTCLVHPASVQSYPSQNVTVIVAFPAGGLADIIARLVSTKLDTRQIGRAHV